MGKASRDEKGGYKIGAGSMINKISEEWSKIEQDLAKGESQELEKVREQILGVETTLKRMCQVSVTRTTVKNAIREALLPVIKEYRDELFPELVEVRRRLEAAGEDPSVLDIYRGELPAVVPEEIQRQLDGFGDRIQTLTSEVEDRVFREGQAWRRAGEEFRASLLTAEEKIQQVQDYLGQLEASIPEKANAAAGEVESRLRKEIDDMVEQLSGKLSDVQGVLRHIEEIMPHKELLESLDRRLGTLDTEFRKVSQQVGNIDSITPEVQILGDRFASLRRQISDVNQTLAQGTGDFREAFGRRLDELQGILREGIDRWESDQSQTKERLCVLRDTLRDQLGALTQQVAGAKSSFWGKVTGKKDAGLKLRGEDFEALSGRLEGIIGSLESVIAQKKLEP